MENMDKTKIIGGVISGIVTALVVGEVFGAAISRPISAWRGTGIKLQELVETLKTINQRLCVLEDKNKEEAK